MVPLYLAECLSASSRGKGTGIFQWLLTLGIVAAALVGIYYSYRVAAVTRIGDAAALFAFKRSGLASHLLGLASAWPPLRARQLSSSRSRPAGSSAAASSDQALTALLRSRSQQQAELELHEMEEIAHCRDTELRKIENAPNLCCKRKYVIPFLLACVILACNTATGINSIIGYNVGILLQSGLSDLAAHWGYVVFTFVNFLMTIVGMMLVDRKGRTLPLHPRHQRHHRLHASASARSFSRTEKLSIDCAAQSNPWSPPIRTSPCASINRKRSSFSHPPAHSGAQIDSNRASLGIIYSYGDFTSATSFVRSDDPAAAPITIDRASCVPCQQSRSLLQESLRQPRRRAHRSAQNPESRRRQRARRPSRLARRARPLRLHGLLRHGPRRLRLARAL